MLWRLDEGEAQPPPPSAGAALEGVATPVGGATAGGAATTSAPATAGGGGGGGDGGHVGDAVPTTAGSTTQASSVVPAATVTPSLVVVPAAVAPATPAASGGGGDGRPLERWTRLHTMRRHLEDVQDVAWSEVGDRLASASVDNSVVVWDAVAGTAVASLTGHVSFVLGVAWHPTGGMLASLSSDRSLRVYGRGGTEGKREAYTLLAATAKAALPPPPPPPPVPVGSTVASVAAVAATAAAATAARVPVATCPWPGLTGEPTPAARECVLGDTAVPVVATPGLSLGGGGTPGCGGTTASAAECPPTGGAAATAGREPKERRLFAGDGVRTFFRRLAWSPDGDWLVCPAGMGLPPGSVPASDVGTPVTAAAGVAGAAGAAAAGVEAGAASAAAAPRSIPLVAYRPGGGGCGKGQRWRACGGSWGRPRCPHLCGRRPLPPSCARHGARLPGGGGSLLPNALSALPQKTPSQDGCRGGQGHASRVC